MVLTLGVSMWVTGLLVALFLLVSLLLILAVLIQRPQGGGLSGAFGAGGAGSGQTAFGAKTGDALTITTVVTFVIWLCVAVALVFATRSAATAETGPERPAVIGDLDPETDPATTPPTGDGAGDGEERIRLQIPPRDDDDADRDTPEPNEEPIPDPEDSDDR